MAEDQTRAPGPGPRPIFGDLPAPGPNNFTGAGGGGGSGQGAGSQNAQGGNKATPQQRFNQGKGISGQFYNSNWSMGKGADQQDYLNSQTKQDYGLSQTGQQFLNLYTQGKLPAAQEAELQQAQQQAIAQVNSTFASMGIDTNSTMAQSARDQAKNQVLSAKAGMLDNELNAAFTSFGMSQSMMGYFTPTQVATTEGQYRLQEAQLLGQYQTAQNVGSGLFGLAGGLLGGLGL